MDSLGAVPSYPSAVNYTVVTGVSPRSNPKDRCPVEEGMQGHLEEDKQVWLQRRSERGLSAQNFIAI